jgi:hypothetical protein
MLHRRFREMTDTELQDAISAARSLAGSESPAVQRLGDYGFEAARRLVDPVKARRAALGAYCRGVGRRSVVVLWWLHVAALLLLCGMAADEAGRSWGRPGAPLALAAALAGACIAIRWIFSGERRFGPPRA